MNRATQTADYLARLHIRQRDIEVDGTPAEIAEVREALRREEQGEHDDPATLPLFADGEAIDVNEAERLLDERNGVRP